MTIAAQRLDGLWSYGRGAGLEWIDAFHTGYILDGLAELATDGHDSDLADSLRRGFEAYAARFFTPTGEPKYTPSSVHPIDIHAPRLRLMFSRDGRQQTKERIALARRVCDWTLANLLDPRGYFYFQRHRFFTNRIPYIRWGEAHMFKALTSLLVALETGQQ